jgi:hypothetical protein
MAKGETFNAVSLPSFSGLAVLPFYVVDLVKE